MRGGNYMLGLQFSFAETSCCDHNKESFLFAEQRECLGAAQIHQ